MIRIYYSNIQNFGDWLNPYLIEELTGKKAIFSKRNNANFCGIGSLMNQFTKKRILAYIKHHFSPEIHIWTTGFIQEASYKESFSGRKIIFLSLRGKLSQQRVEKIIDKKLDIPLGDGGLLFNTLLKSTPKKQYSIGIIPHVNDYTNPIFNLILEKNKHSKIINFKENPLKVLNDIASCEVIISTAMHGLVAADSLGIPNQWIEVSNNVIGARYKFEDYYSVFNIEKPTPLYLKNTDDIQLISLNTIIDKYLIKQSDVDKIRENIYTPLHNIFR